MEMQQEDQQEYMEGAEEESEVRCFLIDHQHDGGKF